jgi:hypothetical protein
MKDHGTPTTIVSENGTIYLAPKPCTCCGCFLTYEFECNCGQVHSDVCLNCNRFADMQHQSVEALNAEWEAEFPGDPPPDTRCTAGAVEHEHPDT